MPEVTVESFREWLASKNEITTFDFIDYRNCCFAQFLKDQGHEHILVGVNAYIIGDVTYDIPMVVAKAIADSWAHHRGHPLNDITFGEVLRRLDTAMLADA